MNPLRSSRLSRAMMLELSVLAALFGASLAVAIEIYAFEKLYAITRQFEHLELDELLTAVVLLSLTMFGFAWRRFREAQASQDLLRQASHDYQKQAQHDPLTGLYNRRGLLNSLSKSLALAKRNQRQVALLFIDIDKFKGINDELGHEIGDALLQEIAGRFRAQLRQEDILARLGGDEYAVVLSNLSHETNAAKVAEKLLRCFETPFNTPTNGQQLSCSIGIAVTPKDGNTPQTLLQHADLAMYQAKEDGKNQFHFFTEAIQQQAIAQLVMERDLRQAIEQEQFEPYFQPLVDLDTMSVNGFEALIRWQHPQRGLLLPGEFIPQAEKNGLIVPIGRQMLQRSCSELATLQRHASSRLYLSINISARQLEDPDFLQDVKAILASCDVDPHRLQFEITESMLVKNTRETVELLTELRNLGIRISLDDFGTGFSSLAYLRQFSFDQLKIDRSFLQYPDTQGKDTALIRSILSLAKNLGLTAVAEGIETEHQLATLKELSCDSGQGFLFSRPLPRQQALELLDSRLSPA